MSTSNNDKKEPFISKIEAFGNWLVKNAKIVMPVVLAVCVILTVVISVSANKKEAQKQEDVISNNTLEDETQDKDAVPEVPLKENDNPEIAELINEYYNAQVEGDADTVRRLVENIDDKVVMRIQEMSKYIESYPTIDIYYKDGPEENTYVVYVSSKVKFVDCDKEVPGLSAYYVYQGEDGNLYIKKNGEGEESELNYISIVSLQDDVVDLHNKITAEYNNMLAEDEELSKLIQDISKEVEKNIGEELAKTEEESGEGDNGSEGDAKQTDESSSSGTETVVTKVKATDVVNIRSSDSETADRLGKAAVGDEFTLIEKIENGWSKIEYDGGEAYIKSEYLEDVETEEVAANSEGGAETGNGDGGDGSNAGNTSDSQNNNDLTTTGTVTVKENVRIRKGASESSEKVATAYVGEKLDVIMKQADGWTKIKYNGEVAYVKSEFVE